MDRNRGVDEAGRRATRRRAIVLVAVGAALFVIWLLMGGPGDSGGEPPGRLTNQTLQPTTTGSEGDVPASGSGPTATPEPASGTDPVSGLPWVSIGDLPAEARDTLDEIEAGPPYPYDRDGVTFENREGLLPDEEYGYYQEFTVTTPGSSDRGARRIIWGLQDELYYTDDHYASFSRIQP